jgi:hypothetical protein
MNVVHVFKGPFHEYGTFLKKKKKNTPIFNEVSAKLKIAKIMSEAPHPVLTIQS